ncbi:MAG: hypothetical protein QXJ17_04425 [Nitrososphaeria archaeon]
MINKVYTTKVLERSVYHNYFLMKFREPASLGELEFYLKVGRDRAEVILRRRHETIPSEMKLYALRVGIAKGVHKTELVPYYPEIGVDEGGGITYFVAPDKVVNPIAYHVFEQWLLKRWKATRKEKHLLRLLGFPQKLPPQKKLELKWPKWGMDVTELPWAPYSFQKPVEG